MSWNDDQGYRGYKGYRGRKGRGHHYRQDRDYRNNGSQHRDQEGFDQQSFSRGRGGRGKYGGLRGKEIGLFFAQRSKEKRARQEIERLQNSELSLGEHEDGIRRLLNDFHTADNIPPQPAHSGASIDSESDGSICEESHKRRPHSSYTDFRPSHASKHRSQSARHKLSQKEYTGMDTSDYGNALEEDEPEFRKVSEREREFDVEDDEALSWRNNPCFGARGGYRGGRGRSHQYRQDRDYGKNRDGDRGQDGFGQGPSRGKGGKGLYSGRSGKDIGLYYAQRSKEKKARREIERKPVLTLGAHEDGIRQLLDDFSAADNIPPQPVQSGASIGSLAEGSMYEQSERPHTSYTDFESSQESYHRSQSARVKDKLSETEYAAADASDSVIDENTDDIPDLSEVIKVSDAEQEFDFNADADTEKVAWSNLQRNSNLDEKFLRENKKIPSSMMEFRKKLPSYDKRREIVDTVNDSQVIVISGETGCGKTTQVPQFILDDYISEGNGSLCHIICTQPRRISAISVAERVAQERGEKVGESVGYSIRLESKHPRDVGSILFCTTGVLLKYLQSDPYLHRASHIIIDEIHERDLQSDFLMIILKDILPKRPDLKVILMSATLNADQFSKYFYNCPHLSIPGFTYPVEEFYLEDVVEKTGYEASMNEEKPVRGKKQRMEREEEEWNKQVYCRNLMGEYSQKTINSLLRMDLEMKNKIDVNLIHSLLRHIQLKEKEGAVLVFVPGIKEIKDINNLLTADNAFSKDKAIVIPLHSLLPTVNQKEVFSRPPKGVRKIVLATNIAETSITIDDIVYVIDSGKIKLVDFDPALNLKTLQSQWVSKANSKQRRGRAGRVQAGKCYYLYTRDKSQSLINYQRPEILRIPLESLCLQIKILRLGKIEPFVLKAMEKPSMEAIHLAVVTLQNMQALDENEELLPLGVHLAMMPVDPHAGKMLLFGAMLGCLDPVSTVAASLSFKDAFLVPLGKEKLADERRQILSENSKSDHIMLINAFQGWERSVERGTAGRYCWENFLSYNTLSLLKGMKNQFASVLYERGFIDSEKISNYNANVNSGNTALVKAVICAGLYPKVAKVTRCKKFVKKLILQDQQKVSIHPKSVNASQDSFESHWMIYHLMMKTEKKNLYDCTMISPYPLLFFGGQIQTASIEVDNQVRHLVTVDQWIDFFASPTIGELVKQLRRELDMLLERKITKPGNTNWDPKSKEGALLQAIIKLITTEEKSIPPAASRHSSHRRNYVY